MFSQKNIRQTLSSLAVSSFEKNHFLTMWILSNVKVGVIRVLIYLFNCFFFVLLFGENYAEFIIISRTTQKIYSKCGKSFTTS